jgi:hypothetical protein
MRGNAKWRSLNTVIVHRDPSELMIFNINSTPRKTVGGSNTALVPKSKLAFHD